jgi:hypothetical protein
MEVFLLLILFMVSVYILWNCDITMPLKIMVMMLGVAIYFTVFPAAEQFLAVTVPDITGPSTVSFGPTDARRGFPILFGKLSERDFTSMGSLRPSVFGCVKEIGTPDYEQVVMEVGEY